MALSEPANDVPIRAITWPALALGAVVCLVTGLTLMVRGSFAPGIAVMAGGCAWGTAAYRRANDVIFFDRTDLSTARAEIPLAQVQQALIVGSSRWGCNVMVRHRDGRSHRLNIGALRPAVAERAVEAIVEHVRFFYEQERIRTAAARRFSGAGEPPAENVTLRQQMGAAARRFSGAGEPPRLTRTDQG